MTGGGLGVPGPPHFDWGGEPSGCSPLLRPTRSAAAARSPARPGAALPPRPAEPLLRSPIVSYYLATRPHRAALLPNAGQPASHPAAARTHRAAEFDLGRGAS